MLSELLRGECLLFPSRRAPFRPADAQKPDRRGAELRQIAQREWAIVTGISLAATTAPAAADQDWRRR